MCMYCKNTDLKDSITTHSDETVRQLEKLLNTVKQLMQETSVINDTKTANHDVIYDTIYEMARYKARHLLAYERGISAKKNTGL